MALKLKPLGDRLIVQAIEEEATTASGIVLPDTAKEKPQRGKVLAVGDGALNDDGKRQPLDVAEGDEVLYSSTAAPRSTSRAMTCSCCASRTSWRRSPDPNFLGRGETHGSQRAEVRPGGPPGSPRGC